MNLHELASNLSRYPKLKRLLKNGYQFVGCMLSNRATSPETICCVSSNKNEHLFGYYDKSPWNIDGTKMIYLEVNDAHKSYVSKEAAAIIVKDLVTNTEQVVAYTHTWNVQQGCMLQWLGPDFNTEIIYNDFRDGKYCSVILNLYEKVERILDFPIYTVSNSGDVALSLDFSRLNTFRPGYGYCNLPDTTAEDLCPDASCIWRIDINTNNVTPIITYQQLLEFESKPSMYNAYHKVNHLMISPKSDKFMFLHRWIIKGRKYDRLITCDLNGGNLYNLLDEDMVSHSNWKDNDTIITWANTYNEGTHYYLLKDRTQQRKIFGKRILTVDGHPSFSPNGKFLVTDTYPDFKRKQKLYLANLQTGEISILANVFAGIKYRNEVRCDLHPRWKYNSQEICFDGSQSKKRQVYTINLGE